MPSAGQRPLKLNLLRPAAGVSQTAHWTGYRDAAVWLCHLQGASQRAIAFAFDLDRNQVRSILADYDKFWEFTQQRSRRKILSPLCGSIWELRLRAKPTQ